MFVNAKIIFFIYKLLAERMISKTVRRLLKNINCQSICQFGNFTERQALRQIRCRKALWFLGSAKIRFNKMVQGDIPPDDNLFRAFINGIYNTIDAPVTWFREKIVEPNQKQYPWYHQKFRRVPTIDECYTDDVLCDFEANAQFKRDRAVDSEILNILRMRFEDCMTYESPDVNTCHPLWLKYKQAEEAWFIKYGDLGAYADAKKAYMKQKHRMIWERRHGPLSEHTK